MTIPPSTHFFDLFTRLTEHSAQSRGEAAQALNAHVSLKPDELSYAIKRLVRGLGSSRAAARQGFALALCTLLRERDVRVETVLNEIESETKTSKKERGEEERDKLVGRGFGYLAVTRSTRLAGNAEAAKSVAKGLAALGLEKSWLRELCAGTSCLLIHQITSQQVLDAVEKELAPFLNTTATTPRDAEQLAVLIALAERKTEISGGFTPTVKKPAVVLFAYDAADNDSSKSQTDAFKALCKPLAAAWRADPPRLHIVWEELCPAVARAGLASQLWMETVEPALLRGGVVSPERKCAAFLVFGRLINDLVQCGRAEEITQLLTKTLLIALLAHAGASKKTLNIPARNALAELVRVLSDKTDEKIDRARAMVVDALLERGDKRFDGKSKTNTVRSLLAGATDESAQSHFDRLKMQIRENWAVDALMELANTHAGGVVEKDVLLLFFNYGFFRRGNGGGENGDATSAVRAIVPKSKKKANSDDSSLDEEASADSDSEISKNDDGGAFCRARFFTVLSRSTGRVKDDPDAFARVVRELHDVWKDNLKSGGLTLRKSNSDADSLKSCRKMADWLQTSRETVGTPANEKIVRAFESLILFMGVLLLVPEGEQESVDAVELLDDLKEASKRIVNTLIVVSDDSKKSAKKKTKTDPDQTDAAAVAVDVMLSLLGRPSKLIRDLVVDLAQALSSEIADSSAALDSLMNVLNSKQEEDMQDDADEDGEDGPDDEKPKPAAGNKKRKRDQAAAEPEEEAEEPLSSSSSSESESESGDSVSEQGDASEIAAYDQVLGEYLKNRLGATQKSKVAVEIDRMKTQLVFKLRVLDVLEAVVQRASDRWNVANLSLGLLSAAELAQPTKKKMGKKMEKNISEPSKGLFDRLRAVQQKLYKSKSLPVASAASDDYQQTFTNLLNGAMEVVKRSKNVDVAVLGMDCVGFALRLAKKSPENERVARVAFSEAFAPVIKEAIGGRSETLNAKLLTDFVDKYPDFVWYSLNAICDTEARSPYQRSAKINVLGRLLTLRKDGTDSKEGLKIRDFAFVALQKEEEEFGRGKGDANKIRSALKFVQQVFKVVPEVGSPAERAQFKQSMIEILQRFVRNSNSPAVKQMSTQLLATLGEAVVASSAAAATTEKTAGNKEKKKHEKAAAKKQRLMENDENVEAAAGDKSKKKSKLAAAPSSTKKPKLAAESAFMKDLDSDDEE